MVGRESYEDITILESFLLDAPKEGLSDVEIEQQALEFATSLGTRERELAVLDMLASSLHEKSPELKALIDMKFEERYGTGITEISLHELSRGLLRILNGKNPAIVLRSHEYEDFRSDLIEPIQTNTDLVLSRETMFPSVGMVAGDSSLHLDNFIESFAPGYSYTLSAAKVYQGAVVFMAGFASKAAQRLSKDSYRQRHADINAEPAVQGVFNAATYSASLAPKRLYLEYLKTDIETISLFEGDVVIWPQGGIGSAAPVWHAVRQLGNPDMPDFLPRRTISYHFSHNPNAK